MTPSPSPELFAFDASSNWVRLRTLILLRWLALAGQAIAILAAQRLYGLDLDLGLCFIVVLAGVVANLGAIFIFPGNVRLTEAQTMGMLLFDILQLAMLLFLTGGLNNPFTLLILAPVTISASTLQLRTTVFLGAVSIALVSALAVFHMPMMLNGGQELRVPPVFAFGFWLGTIIGIVFLGLYSWRVASEVRSMSEALLATQMALAREQKLTDLGGVVAAAAHELGTPLATIKLVSSELLDELKDSPELAEDVALIRDQANRCRDILRSMGRAGKDDLHLRRTPMAALLREAAEPHLDRGKEIVFALHPGTGGDERQPSLTRQPEIIHGLRNLIQNAVDFAAQTVWIEGEWTPDTVIIRISDDGPGYPPHVIGRIGDPFVRARQGETDRRQRPEYEGMGLGLFIAKTLLERSGAELDFTNGEGHPKTGAIVTATWPRTRIGTETDDALGDNVLITG
ncbi:sensor histidine kinase [Defluviimonas sp. 20V17]|uniref:histidine kinase n=1 Tax=Allgaiera indica TaxID=765699 RepID=A0AAN4UN95_9RHOB|nr:ActS/PrrB/RegB family redox-sensitive histidine kinase [Allgaiera indica]KDB03608.1 sensor histidine kinase [Defluviimonas sp. 20V17]GHD98294.1 sensor histidine kinase RegB [Allgaiera indica]SDW49989.1 two-component system, sensor histidine kinase RegB [Allgaiera indica]